MEQMLNMLELMMCGLVLAFTWRLAEALCKGFAWLTEKVAFLYGKAKAAAYAGAAKATAAMAEPEVVEPTEIVETMVVDVMGEDLAMEEIDWSVYDQPTFLRRGFARRTTDTADAADCVFYEEINDFGLPQGVEC